jgi:hypothetical protein
MPSLVEFDHLDTIFPPVISKGDAWNMTRSLQKDYCNHEPVLPFVQSLHDGNFDDPATAELAFQGATHSHASPQDRRARIATRAKSSVTKVMPNEGWLGASKLERSRSDRRACSAHKRYRSHRSRHTALLHPAPSARPRHRLPDAPLLHGGLRPPPQPSPPTRARRLLRGGAPAAFPLSVLSHPHPQLLPHPLSVLSHPHPQRLAHPLSILSHAHP